MRIGIEVVQEGLQWSDLCERVRLVEDLGFDGAWVFDHLRPIAGDPNGPCLEGWTLLAALGLQPVGFELRGKLTLGNLGDVGTFEPAFTTEFVFTLAVTVAATLLTIAVAMAGILGYLFLPVSPLP